MNQKSSTLLLGLLLAIVAPAFLAACSSSSGGGGAGQGTNDGGGTVSGDGGTTGLPSGDDSGGTTPPQGDDGGGTVTPTPDGGTPPVGDGGGHPIAGDGGPGTGGPPFAAGTICNKSGHPLTPPATLKHLIVFLFENENYASVNGNAAAPYMNSIANQCGLASKYVDNTFTDNLVSLPHYLALTSGSNCNTGLDQSGSGCIADDNDATSHTLTTTSIFSQVSSWKAYQEAMPSACDQSSPIAVPALYACKHNPPAYFTSLASGTCTANDVPVAAVTCNASKTMTACTTPSNAFTQDLANDTLPEFAFFTPTLQNDMHDGTVTQGDNFLYTYLPLVLQSKAYLRGDVAVYVLWDEQDTSTFGGPIPNFFVSPYITSGTVSATEMNHFAALRSFETALGISTYLGCASGNLTGATCPTGSTADLRAAIGF